MYINKDAQWDVDSILSKLRAAGTAAKDTASTASGQIRDYYNKVAPDLKDKIIAGVLGDDSGGRALRGGLIGAGVGATALGLAHAMNPRDPDERRNIPRHALIGALLGGTAGASIPLGKDMLDGTLRFGNEPTIGLIDSLSANAGRSAVHNYGATAGAVGGGILGARRYKNLIGGIGLKGPSASHVAGLLKTNPALSDATRAYWYSKLVPGVSQETVRNVAQIGRPELVYKNLTKPMLSAKTLAGLPRTGKYLKYLKRPSFRGMTNFKDPRVKLLATILALTAAGTVVQKGVEGRV